MDSGPVPVTVVKSAVIGLVGTAPTWAVEAPAVAPAVNTATLVSSALDAENFGPLVQGYSIPYALAAIQSQGAGQAIVVNVFDPARHFTSVAASAFTFNAQGAINLGHMGVSNVVVTSDPTGTTYVANTDYTLDPVNGVITIIPTGSGGHIASGATVLVAFNYADPTKVADSDIIGAVTGGVYTGIQALQTTYGTMGFFAKILIAPRYSQNADVAAAEVALANKIRAVALIDSSPSTPVANAISNRGVTGNAFNTSSVRAILCYPQEMFYDTGIVSTGLTLSATGTPITTQVNATSVGPYSSWIAGAIAARDLADGYWWSPSNFEVEGILGPDVQIYASAVDASSDVNAL
ncbi:MAG TPA: phage tail sheath subtilisin-like domain-containing protein, partial [Candidatus Binataceae bacterium]|nr:phage tail sheath subtilisin-like domain-containing protein [Candidatus Binataceae bacterium]